MNDHLHIFAKGLLGTVASIAGIGVSLLPQIEQWLRLASLLIGCAVGLATLVSILRKGSPK